MFGSVCLGAGSNCKLDQGMRDKVSLTKCISWIRRLPWWLLRYRTCSSSWERRTQSQRSSRGTSCTRSSPTDGLWKSTSGCWRGWTARRYLVRTSNQHLWVRYPNRICHQGQTTANHKWVYYRIFKNCSFYQKTYPSWGTSWTLSNCLIWSRVSMLGERPPWRQKIWLSTTAVSGR